MPSVAVGLLGSRPMLVADAALPAARGQREPQRDCRPRTWPSSVLLMGGRVITFVMLLGVLVCSACDRGASNTAQGRGNSCFQPTIRVLYWPAGDPSAKPGSAERTDPHLEIYRGDGDSSLRRDRMLYVSAKAFSGPCAGPRRSANADARQMSDKQTVYSKPVALTCRADRILAFDDLDVEPGYMQVRATPRKLLYAAFTPHHLNPNGPMIRFDGKACTVISPPNGRTSN